MPQKFHVTKLTKLTKLARTWSKWSIWSCKKTTIKRSGVLFQAVFRRSCFSFQAFAQHRPFLLFQANSICRSL